MLLVLDADARLKFFACISMSLILGYSIIRRDADEMTMQAALAFWRSRLNLVVRTPVWKMKVVSEMSDESSVGGASSPNNSNNGFS